MDIQRGNISLYGSFTIVILGCGMMSHVMALPVILNVAGRDAWIAVIFAFPFLVAWLTLYAYLIRNLQGLNFIDWAKQYWGKAGGLIVTALMAILLLFNGMYTLLDTVMWTGSTYLKETPTFVVALCLMLVCFLIALSGLQSVTIVSSILLPLVVVLGFFVATANTKHKDYSMLLPIFENGYMPSISGAMYVMSAWTDVWILLLYSHRFKQPFKTTYSIFLAVFLLVLCFGPIVGGITEFGPQEAQDQRHTAFDQWKIVSLGRLLQHVDFLSIYQWLSGSVARISISLFLLVEIFQFNSQKKSTIAMITCACIMVALTLIGWREDTMLWLIQHIYFPAQLAFIVSLTIAIWISQLIINRKSKRKEVYEQDEFE